MDVEDERVDGKLVVGRRDRQQGKEMQTERQIESRGRGVRGPPEPECLIPHDASEQDAASHAKASPREICFRFF